MSKQDKTWTRESFTAAAAKALWEIHQASRLREQAASALGIIGVTLPDNTADGTAPEFAFPPAEAEDTRISASLTLADLTPEARNRREARQVTQMRQEVYDYLRGLVQGSDRYCARGPGCPNHGSKAKPAEVTRHFDALGFPHPVQTTEVQAYIRQGDKLLRVYATVPGEMTREQAKAKLESIASHSSEHDAAEAAFGPGTSPEDLVHEVYVDTRTNWADTGVIK